MGTPRLPLVIGDARVDTQEWLPVDDRATGAVIAEVAAGRPEDVDAAVAAARAALPVWAALAPLGRAEAIRRYAAVLDAHQGEMADLIHREEGKPRGEAQAEVARACEVMHHFAGEAERLWTMQLPGATLSTGSIVRPDPMGVVAAITPWNFPVALVLWKLAPALAAGCAMVVKPAIEAPLAARMACDLATAAGIPDGVVSCITGDGPVLGEALCTHPGVDKVAFTGSRRVAEQIAAWASPRLKALSLELGGHGALVVLDDADLDVAAEVALVQGYANAGQACYSVNRVLVPRHLESAFLERLRPGIAGLTLGPMATDRGRERHAMLMDDARDNGATVEGGALLDGNYVAPALVTGAGPGVLLVDEEPFTPVVAVIPYAHVDDAVAEVNRPDYGLVSYVCGGDSRRTLEVAERIECGTVVVNGWRVVVPYAPYAGWKGSGVGAELGRPGLEAFIRWQHLRVLA
jgi:succinate-semialdehyde dehydrogenase / glutarate-semialdehyde dehydrogenase